MPNGNPPRVLPLPHQGIHSPRYRTRRRPVRPASVRKLAQLILLRQLPAQRRKLPAEDAEDGSILRCGAAGGFRRRGGLRTLEDGEGSAVAEEHV